MFAVPSHADEWFEGLELSCSSDGKYARVEEISILAQGDYKPEETKERRYVSYHSLLPSNKNGESSPLVFSCSLIDQFDRSYVLSVRRTHANDSIKGVCGAAIDVDLEILVDGQKVVFWPSLRKGCLGGWGPMEDFQGVFPKRSVTYRSGKLTLCGEESLEPPIPPDSLETTEDETYLPWAREGWRPSENRCWDRYIQNMTKE